MGKPIPVTKNPSPTQEEVDSVHQVYVQSLQELFEKHKHDYDIANDEHLKID